MTESASDSPPVPTHVAETVDAIAKLHARSEREIPRQQRSVEAFTAHLGQPIAVWAIAAAAVCWIGFNVALLVAGLRPPDPPPFSWMQAACSLGAVLMATMVLAAQNGQRRVAERHAQLDLHINLLAEQKVAKLVSLLEELRRDMPDVTDRVDVLAEAMTHAVDPRAVVSALQDTLLVEPTAHGVQPADPEMGGERCPGPNVT
jgi:uncharacterized membrane protein